MLFSMAFMGLSPASGFALSYAIANIGEFISIFTRLDDLPERRASVRRDVLGHHADCLGGRLVDGHVAHAPGSPEIVVVLCWTMR